MFGLRSLSDLPYLLRAFILVYLIMGAAGIGGLVSPDGNHGMAIMLLPLLRLGLIVWKGCSR